MKIIYTINGQECTYSVSGRDKYELQRIMNDGVGIPADPMLDVLVFAAYMGEYPSLYSFYQEIIEEFLDPDELFDSEPIEYFNTVLQPMFSDDVIKILDITDWDMMENKKRAKGMERMNEDVESILSIVTEEQLLKELHGFIQDTLGDMGSFDFEDSAQDKAEEWFRKGLKKAAKLSLKDFGGMWEDYTSATPGAFDENMKDMGTEGFVEEFIGDIVYIIFEMGAPDNWSFKLERIASGNVKGSKRKAEFSDEVVNALADATESMLLDEYAERGIDIPSFDIIQGNSYYFPYVTSRYIRSWGYILYGLEHDGFNPLSTTAEDVVEVLSNTNSNIYKALRNATDFEAKEGISNLAKSENARAYLERNGVEVPDNLEEILSNWENMSNWTPIIESSKRRVKESSKRQYRDPMRKVRALREEEEAESEEGTVTFTPDELKFIAGRMFVESEWGASVYDGDSLEIIKSILAKMDEAGIEYK